jgi:acetyl-CoA C-acetyltransferase
MDAERARWPVLVGVGTVAQHLDVGSLPGLGVHALMAEALRRAFADAGGSGLARRLDAVVVPRGTWSHADPGREVARAVGAGPVRSVVGEVGVLQQTLLVHACRLVAAGEARVVAVVGGEATNRVRVAGRAGFELPAEPDGADLAGPDEVLAPVGEIITRMEVERHLGVPVHQYALVESVLAHRAGHAPGERAEHVARLWACGSEVARSALDAWRPEVWTAEALGATARGNRLLATPYRRWCVSDWTVDQAAALVITSVGEAERLGIEARRWVAPVGSGETNHMVPLPARADVASQPAWRLIAEELGRSTGLAPAACDHVDLYSCFPSAVQVAADELGLDLAQRPWTVTGGMTFGGGPFNSYVLHATAEVARRLRERVGSTGLVTSVSGLLTKVAAATWRSGPPELAPAFVDVSERAGVVTPTRRLEPDLAGSAVVVAATVVHERGLPARALAIVEGPAGDRSVVVSEDPGVLDRWVRDDVVGTEVLVEGVHMVSDTIRTPRPGDPRHPQDLIK